MQRALRDLPKAFSIPNVAKGTFPYMRFDPKFDKNMCPRCRNEPQFYGTRLTGLPDLRYYAPESLSSDELEPLVKWHTETHARGETFDQDKEIVDYCCESHHICTVMRDTLQVWMCAYSHWRA